MSNDPAQGSALARSAVLGGLAIAFTVLLLTDGQPTSALALVKGAGLSGALSGIITEQIPPLLPAASAL